MKMKIGILILIFLCAKTKQEVFVDTENLNMTEIIAAYGYPIEVHTVVTDDGYILDIYRLPYGRNSTTNIPNKYPVILHHGLFSSAEGFVYGTPDKAYAYFLANQDFDVWIMNDRGTWHSRKHQRLDPDKDPEYWKFTFHEIGIYDTRNTIDYILNLTNKEKLFYIGHSQGGTTGLVLLSEYPEYNQKIILYEGLAAGVFLTRVRHPFFNLAVPLRDFWKDAIPLISSTGIGGASIYQSLHFLQLAHSGKFTQYDWGRKENLRRYNSTTPREYNLSRITCPVALAYGLMDSLAHPEDVKKLSRVLKNVVDLYEVPHKTWTHLDFLWAKDLDKFVLNHIVELFYKFVD